MEAALAEIASEGLPLEADEDNDFVGPNGTLSVPSAQVVLTFILDLVDGEETFEEETFDSDFQSTDEEEAQGEVAEQVIQEEEKHEQRVRVGTLLVHLSGSHRS